MDVSAVAAECLEGKRIEPSESKLSSGHASDLASRDHALVALGCDLRDAGYRFTTPTPATHARVNARSPWPAPTLRDIFGWSRPFEPQHLSEVRLMRLAQAGALEVADGLFKSRVRFSTLNDQLFVHSSFPTDQPDAVFFGPDTYRFARFVGQALRAMKPRRRGLRILDIGAGSGAGGLYAAALPPRPPSSVVLTDINQQALRYCRINTALNVVTRVRVVESDLFQEISEAFDLIIANPPYLIDSRARLYRHGGGDLGFDLSLRIVEQGIEHLEPGGRLVLYTGSAIIDGIDLFQEAVRSRLAGRKLRMSYEEIDPDVFGEELADPPYDCADRIAVVGVIIDRC
jgi:methylase of polypeptide subunit release factors